MENLNQIKIQLKKLIPKGIPDTIKALKELLPEGSRKYDEVLLLEGRLNEVNKKRLRNIISDADLQLTYGKIRSDLLDLIDGLAEADFDKNFQASQISEDKKVKKGSLLHRIPHSMKVGEETRCVVRVALDEDVIIKNIELDQHVVLKSVRISDVMQVELIDPSEAQPFSIRALNSAEQFVDEDDYTEWQFVVKPLMEGTHSLLLKVSVIELINEKERKREIVLEEKVVITTEAVQQEASGDFKSSGHSFAYFTTSTIDDPPVAPANPLAPLRKSGSGLRRLAFSLAILVFIASTTYAVTPEDERAWVITNVFKNTEEGYENYIKQFPESRHRKTAFVKKAEITEAPDDFRQLIETYPEARAETRVVNALKKIEPKVWQEISQDTAVLNIKALSDYQFLFPESPKKAVVEERTQKLETKVVRAIESSQTKDVELLKAYKTWFPEGAKVKEVEKKLEEVSKTPEKTIQDDGLSLVGDGEVLEDVTNVVTPKETQQDEAPKESDAKVEVPQETVKDEVTTNNEAPKEVPPTPDQTDFNMIRVKGGSFTMGCTEEQGSECYDRENPPHQVELSDFYISQFEVTQQQWRMVMGSDSDPSYFTGCDNCPVEGVSWNDVQEFLKKLNQKTGNKYRLPTEAEWEYAARGGQKSKKYKYSGSNDIGLVAWYYGNSASKTHEVGKKQPNELGLYDMSGNVYEWCQDDWHNNYEGAPKDGSAWGNGSGSARVIRGGRWSINARGCRVSSRISDGPGYRSSRLGFRLARSL